MTDRRKRAMHRTERPHDAQCPEGMGHTLEKGAAEQSRPRTKPSARVMQIDDVGAKPGRLGLGLLFERVHECVDPQLDPLPLPLDHLIQDERLGQTRDPPQELAPTPHPQPPPPPQNSPAPPTNSPPPPS